MDDESWNWGTIRWRLAYDIQMTWILVMSVLLILLCFDLLTRPKMPFKVMHRKEVTHSDGSYERKSRGRKLADEMGRGKKNPIILSYTDAPEESDLWTGWQLFPLDDDHTGHSKESGSDTSRSLDIGRSCGGVSISPRGSLKVI